VNTDNNQPWSFFWSTPDPDYDTILAQEREQKRKIIVRRSMLVKLIAEGTEDTPPQAS